MPKIVDHDAYREEIAEKAVAVFRRRGYSGIGMREIAKELGMSKSALYHYYPSKDALFLACSRRVASVRLDSSLSPIDALVSAAREWESVFAGELRIILDYIGDRGPDDVRDDPAIREASEGMTASVAALVGTDCTQEVLAAMFGVLLLRWFDGRATSFEVLEAMLRRVLSG
jgi:TetR/AcrR family transcriptional regulator, transcriptional repressor of aconitase